MLSKAARELLAQGKAQGLEQGLQLGREKGLALGEAKALLLLLEHKFGPVPEEARKTVLHASVEQLDRWLDQIQDAASLEEVFAEPGPQTEP